MPATVVAGSRSIQRNNKHYKYLAKVLSTAPWNVSRIVVGDAKGVDQLAQLYARNNGIPFEVFEADWDDISGPDAVVKTDKEGNKYNAAAGPSRNEEMVEVASAAAVLWDGESPGSKDVMRRAKKADLDTHFFKVEDGALQRVGSNEMTDYCKSCGRECQGRFCGRVGCGPSGGSNKQLTEFAE